MISLSKVLTVSIVPLTFKQRFECRLLRKLSYRHKIGKEPLSPLTLGKVLQKAAEDYGERDAIVSVYQNKSLSYKSVLEKSDKLAAALKGFGLKKGDRVGLWSTNSLEWYIAMFACARAGVVLVTINPAYQPPELEYCINKVGIKCIICEDKYKRQNYYEVIKLLAPELQECDPGKLKSSRLPSLKNVLIIGNKNLKGAYNFDEVSNLPDESLLREVKESQHLISPDDAFNIQFTSGTTGKPKAAVINHFNLVNNSYQIGYRSQLFKKYHRVCSLSPFFHAMGTVVILPAAVHFGSAVVIPSPTFNGTSALDAIVNERCTVIIGTPTMYLDLIKVQEEKTKEIAPDLVVTGGAPCSPHLFQKIHDVLRVKRIQSVYGLTEATAVAFQSLVGDDKEKILNTVGHVGDHLEVKVVDKDNNIVPYGTPGELCVRGYSCMMGYWDDEQKTKEIMGSDRWLKTGDQFILQEDGYGRIVGRIKEMINRGGENIFPKEIEDFLMAHPDIEECYVVGLPHERLGEEVAACIKVKSGATLSKEDIVEFCKGKMAYFKIPSKIAILESFPKTASGKVQKFKLKEQLTRKFD